MVPSGRRRTDRVLGVSVQPFQQRTRPPEAGDKGGRAVQLARQAADCALHRNFPAVQSNNGNVNVCFYVLCIFLYESEFYDMYT